MDNIFLTIGLQKEKEKKSYVIQDELQIKNEVIQYIGFVMYPSEVMQSCGVSNFGHDIYYMAPTKGG